MLFGRDDDIAELAADLSAGRGAVVVGEAGVGKTALLDAALQRSGRAVSSGQCFRSLSWNAGLPLQQATGRPVPAGDPAWAAQWLVQGTAGTVLRLDDLQWADPLTLAVVELLPADVTFAVTVRTGDPGTEAAVAAVAASPARSRTTALGPLDVEAGAQLARRRHPRISSAEAAALARRCGGNPLLIQELGDQSEPATGLRRAVMTRLRRLGDPAWADFALLALAGEPVPRSWLPAADVLVGAGLVSVDERGLAQPRHPLLAEVMADELATATPTGAAIARRLGDLAEGDARLALAARALAAAGERPRALRCALRAAEESERPGARAGLLCLAAQAADADEARELTLRAVGELVDVGDYAQAGVLIDQLPGQDSPHWYALRGRVHWQRGEDAAALEAFTTGLAMAPPRSGVRVVLLCEQARAVLLGLGEAARGLQLAQDALAEARALGVEQARALAVLGTAEHFVGLDDCVQHLSEALTLAEGSDDLMVEFTTANNLVAVHEGAGDGRLAGNIADRYADRAEALHLRGWQTQMRAMGLNVRLHLGEYGPILAEIPAMLNSAVDRRTRDQLAVTYGLAMADLGRPVEEWLTAALAQAAEDHSGRGNLLWVLSECRLWNGDPVAALRTAREALALAPPGGLQLFALLTIAHARAQLGEVLDAEEWPEPHVRLLHGAHDELAGLVARSRDDHARATLHFSTAAALWTGQHHRGELRCRWLAADGDEDDQHAREQLLILEGELSDLGWAPLLGQVRRSLRRRGVRSAAPRGRAGTLTAREREVLDLVAEGLSTDAVAARLSLSPTTVAAHIASARARLGASTRWQAASE